MELTLGLFHLKSYQGVSVLNFLDHSTTILHIFGGYPTVILQNNLDHPVAISKKQVEPPLPYCTVFLGYPAVAFLTFTTTNPMEWGGWKKLSTLQCSGGLTLIPPRSDTSRRLFVDHHAAIQQLSSDCPVVIF